MIVLAFLMQLKVVVLSNVSLILIFHGNLKNVNAHDELTAGGELGCDWLARSQVGLPALSIGQQE